MPTMMQLRAVPSVCGGRRPGKLAVPRRGRADRAVPCGEFPFARRGLIFPKQNLDFSIR